MDDRALDFLIIADARGESGPPLRPAHPPGIGYEIYQTGFVRYSLWHGEGTVRAMSSNRMLHLFLVGSIDGADPRDPAGELLAAYLHEGPDFARRLKGSFGLVLLDLRNQALLAVTDEFNSRKLYVANRPGWTAISPRQAYLDFPEFGDDWGVDRGLTLGAIRRSRLLDQEVREIERGSVHAFREGKPWRDQYCREY